jgi:manganese transport protein
MPSFGQLFHRFIGPGYLVAVGYMDPGNWATDLAAGSKFGYSLLFVILLSNFMAVFLQYLCIKLGIASKKDLAENCRIHCHPYLNLLLYVLCEIAIIATDLAELIGSAIAINLLFGLPLYLGILITALDVLFILVAWNKNHVRFFEMGILLLVFMVAICFFILVFQVQPDWSKVFLGYLPSTMIVTSEGAIYLAMGIVGATVMPHNLYLHSNVVKLRASEKSVEFGEIHFEGDDLEDSPTGVSVRPNADLIKFSNYDSMIALTFAFLINSSILIVAAAAFGGTEVGELSDAFYLLSKNLGAGMGILFAVALLLSGQSSTITGTLAGQIVMVGFLGDRIKLAPWMRRLITRSLAITPAMIVAIAKGDHAINDLLVLSQVILSLQLPFAVWPLVYFTSHPDIMSVREQVSVIPTEGESLSEEAEEEGLTNSMEELMHVQVTDFSNKGWMKWMGYLVATLITVFNIVLLVQIAKS